jgi:hypothetical protein
MLAVRKRWQVQNKHHHLAHAVNFGLPNTVAALRQVPPQSAELRAHIGQLQIVLCHCSGVSRRALTADFGFYTRPFHVGFVVDEV